MKFRKRPVIIEAVQWRTDNLDEIIDGLRLENDSLKSVYPTSDGGLYIRTLEGQMLASHGDWIIKGVAGELYPCKPDIFERTYEAV